MLKTMKVVNTKIVKKVPLKKLISENYGRHNGKFFYSVEVTAKDGLVIDFSKLKTLPLFVDITWIKDENLKVPMNDALAFQLANKIESSQVVNSISCYKLTDVHLDEFLGDQALAVKNLNILRGDAVDANQKYKFANELIIEIRRRAVGDTSMNTIMAAGYPETHVECQTPDEDIHNLKRKVESGVDVILTQVVFSAAKFVEFVMRCRTVGISSDVPIIPGLYVPLNLKQLDLILKISKASIDRETYEKFKELDGSPEDFESFSLRFATKLISQIQEMSPEFTRGFHFFTMNNFKMIEQLTEVVEFSADT